MEELILFGWFIQPRCLHSGLIEEDVFQFLYGSQNESVVSSVELRLD